MSLVGSSIVLDDISPLAVSTAANSREEEDDDDYTQQDLVTAYDAHPPLTPPGAAESLFLAGLPTATISANALAQAIHSRHRPFSIAGTSIATDDFASAHQDDNLSRTTDEAAADDNDDTLFGKDALLHTREILVDEDTPENTQRTMPAAIDTTTGLHADPAEKVYDTAKGVWSWGKGIIIFSPFMGLAEGIAGKIVETAGSSMEDLDSAFLDKLHGLDDGVLNPAIEAIVGTVMGAKGKTEDFVMPILAKLLSPFGLLKGESTLKPDGTETTTEPATATM